MNLVAPSPWREVREVAITGSTNADLCALAARGEPGGLVLVAYEQTAGRGRLDRSWVSPPGAGLTLSLLLRPTAVIPAWSWAPLLMGLAVADALHEATTVEARIKWPNDIRIHGRKVAGVLAERVAPDGLVIGLGLNVDLAKEQLPIEAATSLLVEGVDESRRDRQGLLNAVLGHAAERLAHLRDEGPPPSVINEYMRLCETLGERVNVVLPGGRALAGFARAVTSEGALEVVDDLNVVHTITAGDVVHVR